MTPPSNYHENAIAEFRESCESQLMLMSYGIYYFGTRTPSGHCLVLVAEDGEIIGELPPRLELHSPKSIPHNLPTWDWGNNSPAAAHLALALLAERITDPASALSCHLNLTSRVIAKLPQRKWLLNGVHLADWFTHRDNPAAAEKNLVGHWN